MEEISEKFKYTCPSHAQNLLNSLHTLCKAHEFCDINIQVQNKTFSSHRNVLSAASEYFHAMFTGGLAEMGKENIHIEGISPDVFESLLHFIYSGSVEITSDNCQDLLSAADMIGISGVVDACCRFLKQQLHTSNCIGISTFAENHSCTSLKHAADAFIEKYFLDVIEEEEYSILPRQTLIRILESENLVIENEYQVFLAAMKWLMSDVISRRKHVFDVLAPIRFPLISHKQLEWFIDNCDDLSLKIALRKLVQDFRYDRRLPYELKVGRVKPYLFQPRKCARQNIYVIGGYSREEGTRWSDSHTLGTVECFNTFHEHWKCIPPLQHARSGTGTVVLNGLVYVIGGESDSLIFDNVECLDPQTNKWTSVASMTTPRCGLSACVYDSKIFVLGGWVGVEIGDTIEKYDPQTDAWSTDGKLNTVRYVMGLIEYEGLLYLVGGMSDLGTEMREVESYNPVTHEWQRLASLHTKRAYVGVACLGGCIYAVGGWNEDSGVLNTVECYNIHKDTWSYISPMSVSRAGASVCAVNGLLYVIGGRTSTCHSTAPRTLDSVECYDPHTDKWNCVGPMPSSRCEAGVAIL